MSINYVDEANAANHYTTPSPNCDVRVSVSTRVRYAELYRAFSQKYSDHQVSSMYYVTIIVIVTVYSFSFIQLCILSVSYLDLSL